MDFKKAQRALFDQLIQKLDRPKLAAELKELLFLEKSAIYQRMSGEKDLSAAELFAIAERYGISLDRLRASERTVVFEFPTDKPSEPRTPIGFLEGLAVDFRRLAELPAPLIRYAAGELPFFHYFKWPELALFKLYQWNRIAWRQPFLLRQKFEPRPELFGGDGALRLAEELHELYQTVDSIEIWSTAILDNTLQQIVFSARAGRFANLSDARLLLHQMQSAVASLEKMAETRSKSPVSKSARIGAFEGFHNPTAYTNNFVLIESEKRPAALYATFDNPNYIKSADADFYGYALSAFERLVSVSEPVARGAELNRAAFVERLSARIERADSELAEA